MSKNIFFPKLMFLWTASGMVIFFSCVRVLLSLSSWSHVPQEIGDYVLYKDFKIKHFISDGLMCLFFFTVSIELKKAWCAKKMAGSVSFMGALGGVIVPGLVYVWCAPLAIKGWPIPTATDIVLATTVMGFLGQNIPFALRTLLLSLATIDDMIAMIIMVFFYGHALCYTSCLLTLLPLCGLVLCLRKPRVSLLWCVVWALLMWAGVLHTGLHGSVTGIIIGLLVPFHTEKTQKKAEIILHFCNPWVYKLIVPLFIFFHMEWSGIGSFHIPVWRGVFFGLFLGKPIGVWCGMTFGMWISGTQAVANSLYYIGLACLTGMGLTMSVFMTEMAFVGMNAHAAHQGVMMGSLLSGIIGYGVLRYATHIAKQRSL